MADKQLNYTAAQINALLAIANTVGAVADLTTTAKTSIVAAINEVKAGITSAVSAAATAQSSATAAQASATAAQTSATNAQASATAAQASANSAVSETSQIDDYLADAGDGNLLSLPLLGGQPMTLFGAGTPAEGTVPTNWNQFDPVTETGSNWIGVPTMLGQMYVDTTATAGSGLYISIRSGSGNALTFKLV